MSLEDCLDRYLRPYLKDNINDLKKYDTWKVQLTMAIIFIYSKGNDEERVIHSKSDNIEIMIKYNANEVIEKHFESLLKRYQVELEKSMKGIDFILDYIFILYFLFIFIVHLLCYKFHEIDFK